VCDCVFSRSFLHCVFRQLKAMLQQRRVTAEMEEQFAKYPNEIEALEVRVEEEKVCAMPACLAPRMPP
jgi:hypothetical protein